MEQSKQTTIVGAAHEYCNGVGVIESDADKQYKAFIAGGLWQRNQLLDTLKIIAEWPGNLPDDRLTSKTGPNDAVLRGHMLVTMRKLAIKEIQKLEPNYNPILNR